MATVNKFLRDNKVSKMTKAERNSWYNSLSKPQKAVAICEDVLLQIANEKYVMQSGTYVELQIAENITERTVNDIFKNTQLDEVLKANSITCNVCAMGSCLLSAVRLGNEVETSEVLRTEGSWWKADDPEYVPGGVIRQRIDGGIDFSKLEEAFTVREYRAMEYMFEGSDIDDTFYADEDVVYDTLDTHYTNEYEELDDTQKMVKMCKQIIKYGGYFFIGGVDLENNDK